MTTIIRITLILFLSLFLGACHFDFNNREISGNGNVEDRDLNISGSFDAVRASEGWEVILKKGNENSVSASLDSNLYEHLDVHIDGSRLKIDTEDDTQIGRATSKKIYVTFSDHLSELKASSAATITSESTLEGERLSLDVSSAGTINTEVAVRSVDTDASSAGTINVKGITERFAGDASSAGKINASGLKSENAKADVSSAGYVGIFASKSIHADASSAGNVEYWGNPESVNAQESSSGGSINKK